MEMIFNAAAPLLFDEEPQDPLEFNIGVPSPIPNLSDIEINELDVLKQLQAIDPTKSTTPFCIHPKVLKEAAEELTYPISLIFKVSTLQGKLPDCWKDGIVTPIHKTGDRHTPSNYRPITITSSLCRIPVSYTHLTLPTKA